MEYKKNVNSVILDVGNLKRIAIDKHRNISENSVVYFNKNLHLSHSSILCLEGIITFSLE